jgi:putative transposase
MPRQARLDVPGALHHVMGRGIERRSIFLRREDQEDFLSRLEKLVHAKGFLIYAWALMPNHFHLLVRSTSTPLSHTMRSLMTGYAGYFNRTHHRTGHLFQNRFKSVLCEDDPYLLELVRYIHLNPLRAKIVDSLQDLDHSPLTGHAVLVGNMKRGWQNTKEVLSRFSKTEEKAIQKYRTFISEGVEKPIPKNLEGGGLIRSMGGWAAVGSLRKGRETYCSDERILGDSDFVGGLIKEVESETVEQKRLKDRWSLEQLLELSCHKMGVPISSLSGGSKERNVVLAREGLSYLWVKKLRRSGGDLARATGMKPISIYQSARRGEKRASNWLEWLEK